MRPQDLTDCERKLWREFPLGRSVDLRIGDSEVDNPSAGARWDSDRAVRAEVIRALLLAGPAPVQGKVSAVHLIGARITGSLDLAHADISFPIYLKHCWFEEAPDLRWLVARYLDLSHSSLPGILGDQLRVEGDLVISGCRISGKVSLYRSHISGDLNFRDAHVDDSSGCALRMTAATVSGSVFMGGLSASGEIGLVDAQVSGILDLSGARLNNPGGVAFEGSRITVGGPVFCRDGFTSQGELCFRRARITGFLDFVQAHLSNPRGCALFAPGITIDGGLSCRDQSVLEGELHLLRGRVDGDLDLSAAKLSNPGGIAFEGRRLTVGGAVFCRDGFTCDGEMRLARARITGFLDFAQARLSNPGGNALAAPGISVDGGLICRDGSPSTFAGRVVLDHARIIPDLDLTGACCGQTTESLSCAYVVAEQLRLPLTPVSGTVDLSHAKLGILDAEPKNTPAGIRTDGLTYATLSPLLSARARLEWLSCETGYMPQPYEQLATAYRRIGDDAGARSILLAKERRRHQNSLALVRLWGLVQDVTTGYGYRPALAALWLIALLALGTTIFGFHHPAPIKSTEALEFNPFFYTLDLLIPVVTFGQQAAFGPKGLYQWFAYGLVAAGWLLAITIVSGITRAVSRS